MAVFLQSPHLLLVNTATLFFHLAVNLGLLASPLAAFLYMVVPTHSKLIIAIFTSLCCILGTYILINAFSYGSLITGNIGGVVIVSSHNHHMHTYHINEYIKLIYTKNKKIVTTIQLLIVP